MNATNRIPAMKFLVILVATAATTGCRPDGAVPAEDACDRLGKAIARLSTIESSISSSGTQSDPCPKISSLAPAVREDAAWLAKLANDVLLTRERKCEESEQISTMTAAGDPSVRTFCTKHTVVVTGKKSGHREAVTVSDNLYSIAETLEKGSCAGEAESILSLIRTSKSNAFYITADVSCSPIMYSLLRKQLSQSGPSRPLDVDPASATREDKSLREYVTAVKTRVDDRAAASIAK